ncbi:hypothetical protein FB45DRAFT_890384 [Roridomyces roridus]|uniref:Uncharacterized protein n=1 Tax=Roridomyces roridus TaxID=1738132 RepID=A0AAD7CL25_9AGAR|nr:hypothetical protein FB45DRAFT_890384 [Roridomyces roridus]
MHAVTFTVLDSSTVVGGLLSLLVSLVDWVVAFCQRPTLNSIPWRRTLEKAQSKHSNRLVGEATPGTVDRHASLRVSSRLQRMRH